MSNRVIKFRAWHEGHGRKHPAAMHYEDRAGDALKWLAEGQPVHVMQYTGLKDKNGREIYEGDVVLLPGNPDPAAGDPTAMCVVEYSGPHLVYRDVDHIERNEMIHGILGWDCDEDADAEVIGNIYENPEYLTT